MRHLSPSSQQLSAGLTNDENKFSSQLSKECARGLHALHGEFAGALREALADSLQTPAVTLIALQEATTETLPDFRGYSFAFSALQPQAGVLECSESLALLIVDRLLGGSGALIESPHALSEIELQLLHGTLEPVAAAYAKAWQRAAAFRPRLEGAPGELQPGEPCYVVTYEVRTTHGTGELAFLLRLTAWKDVLSKLGTPSPLPGAKPRNSAMLELIGDCAVSARVLLGRTTINVGDLLSLHAGDIICLETAADSLLEIRINNRPKLLGRAQVQHDQYVITVDGIALGGKI